MKYQLNYELNNRFSSLDLAIFYFVSKEEFLPKYFEVFYIFSKERVAKSIEKLHNNQLIFVNLELGKIKYSQQILKLNQTIFDKVVFEIDYIPEKLYLNSRIKEDRSLIVNVLEKIHFDDQFYNLYKSLNLLFSHVEGVV